MKMKRTLILAGLVGSLTLAGGASAAQAQEQEKAMPEAAAPAKPTTIGQEKARTIAMEKVPGGAVSAEDIQRIQDKLVYSFDIQLPDVKGIERVTVDGLTGDVIDVTHKSPAQVKRDARSKRRRS